MSDLPVIEDLQVQLAERDRLIAELRSELARAHSHSAGRTEFRGGEENRRSTRAELTRQLEELNALFNLLPAAVAIADDSQCLTMRGNPAFYEMLGISPSANASMSAEESRRPTNFRVFRDGRELKSEELTMQLAAATGLPVRDQIMELHRDDGRIVVMLGSAVPLFDAEGKPRGAVGVFLDIAERQAAAAERQRLLAELQAKMEEIQLQAEELEVQAEELEVQAEELRTQNDELAAMREHLQRALEEQSQTGSLYEAVLNNATAGIAVFDGESLRVKFVNAAYRQFLDEPYRDRDLTRLRLQTIVPRAEENGLADICRRVVGTGQASFDPEYEHVGFARGTTYWRYSLLPLPNAGGTPDLMLVATEVTEQVLARRAAEALASQRAEALAALQASEERFRIALQGSPTIVFTMDSDLRYTWIYNPSPRFGNAPQNILGKRDDELMAPPDAAELMAFKREVIERGVGGRRVLRLPQGDDVAVFDITAEPLRDASGAIVGLTGATNDVTERERLAEELRRARDELALRVQERTAELRHTVEALRFQASIVANVTDAVAVTDTQGRIAAFNHGAEEMSGWRAEEVMGRMPAEVFGNAFLSQSREQVFAQLGEQGRWQGELIAHRRDGSELYVDSRATQLKDEAGRVTGYIWVNRDITARREAEQALSASREELRTYSRRLVEAIESERRSLARELHDQAGQSMAALKMSLGRLRREVGGHGEYAGRFEEMGQLVEGVMDDLHRLAMNLRPVSLDRYGLMVALQQYVEFYRQQSGLDVDLVTVRIEEQRLPAELETTVYRVVQEALTNVLRHANAKHVGLMLERHDDEVIAIIEDDGLGFDVDEALRCGRLGLIGMRERAEMMSGSLTIESAPGGGTTLYLRVPAPNN